MARHIKKHVMENIIKSPCECPEESFTGEMDCFARDTTEGFKGLGFRLNAFAEPGEVREDYGQIIIHVFSEAFEDEEIMNNRYKQYFDKLAKDEGREE